MSYSMRYIKLKISYENIYRTCLSDYKANLNSIKETFTETAAATEREKLKERLKVKVTTLNSDYIKDVEGLIKEAKAEIHKPQPTTKTIDEQILEELKRNNKLIMTKAKLESTDNLLGLLDANDADTFELVKAKVDTLPREEFIEVRTKIAQIEQQQPEKVVKMLESNLREDKAYQEPIFSQTSLESDLNSIEGVEIYF
jgi:hypothetical protein